MNNIFFTGIDIGSDKIKICTIAQNSNTLSKATENSFGILNGYIQNGKETSKSLQKTLISAENKIKRPIEKAIFGINSYGLTSKFYKHEKFYQKIQLKLQVKF